MYTLGDLACEVQSCGCVPYMPDLGFYKHRLNTESSAIPELKFDDVTVPPDSEERTKSLHVEFFQILDVHAVQDKRFKSNQKIKKSFGIVHFS